MKTNYDHSNLDRFNVLQEKLKALYKADSTIPSVIRTEQGGEQNIDDYYVNLQMVLKEDQVNAFENSAKDTVGGEKETVGLVQMFDKVADSEATNKVFVLGGPGVGKTTLLHSMSYKWASDGLWQDKFDFVIRVRLKEMLSSNKFDSYNIEDMLPDFIFRCLCGQRNSLKPNQRTFEPFKLEEIKELLSNQMKEKVLLLVDGYDEIAGLKGKDEYNGIIGHEYSDTSKAGGILSFPNVVMTSRPSAVDDKLLGHFSRKIINNGLDSEGASQYIKTFFKDDSEGNGASLKEFLGKHGTIQDMCKTPINVSLICMVWQEPEIQKEIRQDIENGSFKVGQLYEDIIFKLTKRYFEKLDKHTDSEYIEKSQMFNQNVTQAIKDIACYHFVSGDNGLKLSNSENKGKVISGGATGIKGDLLNNFIQEHYGDKKINIEDVVKFGLLNAEGNSRKLTEQTMYFVHLTFKEYMTAYKMYEYLKTNESNGKPSEEAKLAAETIATNRNNPSYLMTLKFLAGIVSDKGNKVTDGSNDVAINRFWQAVSCNLEGVIELGVEEKVKLFMHLLGQSKVQGTFDKKIPNLKEIKKFIDSNIEKQSLNHWQDEIITSGYLSTSILNKVKKLIDLACAAPQGEQEEIKSAFDLVQKLNNDQLVRDNVGDKSKIFDTISKLLQVESLDWQMKRFFIKKLSELAEEIKDDAKLYETSSQIIQFIKDDNLREVSTDCYVWLVKNVSSKDLKISTLEQLFPIMQVKDCRESTASAIGKIVAGDKELGKTVIEQLFSLMKDANEQTRQSATSTIGKIVVSGIDDKELGKVAIEQLLPLLKDGSWKVRDLAASAIGKIAAGDKELKKIVIEQLLPVEGCRSSAAETIGKIVAGDKELTRSAIDQLLHLLQDKNNDCRPSATRAIEKIVAGDKELTRSAIEQLLPLLQVEGCGDSAAYTIEKIVAGDKELTRSAIEQLLPLLQVEDCGELAAYTIGKISVSGIDDKELEKVAIEQLLPLLQVEGCRSSAAKALGKITASGIDDKELEKVAIEQLLPLLQDESEDCRYQAASAIEKIAASGIDDKELEKVVIQQLLPLLQVEDWKVRCSAASAIGNIAASGIDDKELEKVVIQQLLPLMQDADCSYSAAYAIGRIAAGDKELGKVAIEQLLPLLQDENKDCRGSAAKAIRNIAASGIDDKELAKLALEQLFSLLQDENKDCIYSAAKVIGKIAAGDKELGKVAIEQLLPLLQDENKDCRGSAAYAIGNIAAGDKELGKVAIEQLLSLLQDENKDCRGSAAYAIGNIAVGDKELEKIAIEQLLPLMQDESEDCRYEAASAIRKIVAGNKELEKIAIEQLLPLMQDESEDCRYDAASAIRKIATVNLEVLHDLLKHDSKVLRKKLHKSLITKFSSLNKLDTQDTVNLIKIMSVCDAEEADGQKLITLTTKLLKSSIDDLANDEQGFRTLVKAINEGFDTLPKGEHTIALLKQMCHIMLADGKIDSDETKLIIKSIIKKNITVTFNIKENSIIFEGHHYKIDSNSRSISNFNKIVNSVIKESSDSLAKQYRNHEPLFKNEEGSVIDIALSDKKEIFSLVRKAGTKDSTDILSNNKVLISLVHLSDHKYAEPSSDKFFILQEYRNWVGQHVVERICLSSRGKIQLKSFISDGNLDVANEIFIPTEYNTDAGIKPRYYACKFVVNKRTYDKLSKELGNIVGTKNTGEVDATESLFKLFARYTGDAELEKQLSNFNWNSYIDSIKCRNDIFKELKVYELEAKSSGSKLYRKSQEITNSEFTGRLDEIEKILDSSGIKLTSELRERLTAIKAKNDDLFSYCITFIDTMNTCLLAFKMTQEGFIPTKIEENKGAKLVHHTVNSIAVLIPMIGEWISQPMEAAYGTYKNVLTLQARNQSESNLKILQTILPSDQETVISRIVMKILDTPEYVEKIKSYYRPDETQGWAKKAQDLSVVLGSLEDDNYTILNSVGYIIDILCDLSGIAGLQGRTTDQLAREDVMKLFGRLYKQEVYMKNFDANSNDFADCAASLVCTKSLGEHMMTMLDKFEGVYASDYKSHIEDCRADLNKIGKGYILNNIRDKAVKGEWKKDIWSKGKECSEYFADKYLAKLIGNNNLLDENIQIQEIKDQTEGVAFKKKILSFKLLFVDEMCSAMVEKAAALTGKAKSIELAKKAMIKCAYNLGEKYPELVKIIATKFPELFKDHKIAEASLYALSKAQDGSNDNIDIDKLLAEVKGSLVDNGTVFGEIEVGDIFANKVSISGSGNIERYSVENEYDNWFEYYKEGIEKVLQLRLDSIGNKDTEILKLNYVYDGNIGSLERLGKDIINKIDEASCQNESNQKAEISIAVPLNLNNKHWVGLVIHGNENEIKLEYMDSEQNPMPQELKSHLNKLLSEYYKNLLVSVSEKEVAMQSYGNCGLEAIENIIEAIAPGMRIDEENVLSVHSLLLGDSLLSGESWDSL